jgi:sRNA-binding protein
MQIDMDKPWTTSRGPTAATKIDTQKAEAINVLLVRSIGILPVTPGDPIRPFAIGLFDEVRRLLKPEIGATTLRRAIAAFVHSKRYYLASAQPDSMRHDIDGNPIEPLSVSDRLVAQQRFLTLKRDRAQAEPPSPEPMEMEQVPTKAEQIRAALLGRNRLAQRPVG